jgi:hypothetical protein
MYFFHFKPCLCLLFNQNYAFLLASLGKRDGITKLEQAFAMGNMTVNCKRRCFQKYITLGKDLFYQNSSDGCLKEFLREISIKSATSVGSKQPFKSHYPFMEIFYIYRMFRQQVCVSSSPSISDNCFQKVKSAVPVLLELIRSKTPSAFACQAPAVTSVLQQDLYSLMDGLGCCYGSTLGMRARAIRSIAVENTFQYTILQFTLFLIY